MIGAIIGTITATILLFLLGYILLYLRHRQRYPKNQTKTIYPLPTESELPKLPNYQILDSNAARTSDAVRNQGWDQTMEKQRLISKTEWSDPRRIPESRSGNGIYTECPTYDLPSNPTPSAPLPPVPQDLPPPFPPPVTTTTTSTAQFGVPLIYPPTHFLDPITAAAVAAVANVNANNGQSNSLLAQTLTNNAILVDMLTMQRQQQTMTAHNQEFRF